jgi:putative ABC transport system ATP-binding protein
VRLPGSAVSPTSTPSGARVARIGSAIHARGVAHCYRTGSLCTQALDAVDLDIPAGGYAALTGPSGAGKSTLLALIGGLEHPQTGVLRVGDQDLSHLHGDRLAAYRRNTVGFVFQHFGLIDLLSARENVELSAALAHRRSNRKALALSLLDEVGLSERSEHRPSQLSGGERQRVAIARALVNDPSLILADEPTGNLDGDSALRVLDLLEGIHAERGCTLVVVTHNEAVASRADRRYRLDDGRLVS